MTTQVLHVAQPVDGGVGRYVAGLAIAERDAGFTVAVASPPGPLADAITDAGIIWQRWDARRSPDHHVAVETRNLARIVRETRPQAVHLHSSKAGLAGRLLLRNKIPTIFQPHGWSWQAANGEGVVAQMSTRWERIGARWTTALVCVSNAELAAGVARHVVTPTSTAAVVANGVDLERFRPVTDTDKAAYRQARGLDDDAAVVICVGRIDAQKGQDVLVAAWPAVRAAVKSATLVLVGDGPARAELERAADPSVRFVGEQDNVEQWYAAADVVAFSSRYGEAMALTPLEGMASGRPVIASDVAGIRESVGPRCGAIVHPGDSDAYAAAIVERLTDRGLAKYEGENARRFAETHHDIRVTHTRIAELTTSLVR